MSDGVLAAIIAAGATVFTSFLQLRHAMAKELAARSQSASSRRKSRLPFVFMFAMLGGAGVGGFALAQWLHENERMAQDALQRELRARISDMTRTESALELSRAGTRAEIEAGILRRIGTEGVAVLATVAPCRPPLIVNTPALAPNAGESSTQPSQPVASSSPSACTEAEANPVMLCATIPASATLTDVEVYVRAAESDAPWSNSRVTPGHETEQARFAEKPVQVTDGAATKQVCEAFVHWSTERARVARMVVHYSL